jgi:hypothetical protein
LLIGVAGRAGTTLLLPCAAARFFVYIKSKLTEAGRCPSRQPNTAQTPTMSDREFGGNDDLSLPKGVSKLNYGVNSGN